MEKKKIIYEVENELLVVLQKLQKLCIGFYKPDSRTVEAVIYEDADVFTTLAITDLLGYGINHYPKETHNFIRFDTSSKHKTLDQFLANPVEWAKWFTQIIFR